MTYENGQENEVLRRGSDNYPYDPNGNRNRIAFGNETTFTWDAENRLRNASHNASI